MASVMSCILVLNTSINSLDLNQCKFFSEILIENLESCASYPLYEILCKTCYEIGVFF